MNKHSVLFIITLFLVGCGAAVPASSTTPVGHDSVVLSRAEYDRYREDRERRTALVDGQISEEERRAALERYVREHAPEPEPESVTPPPVVPETPTPRAMPPVMPTAPGVVFAPPGMTTETQAFAGGSAPWMRSGAFAGGTQLRVRVNSSYAISLAIDGQMVQPFAGMPTAIPAVTAGGGLVQVPVIPATREGGWRGDFQTREYFILADHPGTREISWTCYSVVSGRPGHRVGSGVQRITLRPGATVYIADSHCR